MSSDDRRFPRWVYAEGDEPDPRFTLANERTFLAWIRTGLGLLAAGVAVAALGGDTADWQTHAVSIVLVVAGVVSGTSAYLRWMRQERAMRRNEPLTGSTLMPVLALVMVVVAVLAVSELL